MNTSFSSDTSDSETLQISARNNVIAFTKVALPYGWLGNMAPFPVKHEGGVVEND